MIVLPIELICQLLLPHMLKRDKCEINRLGRQPVPQAIWGMNDIQHVQKCVLALFMYKTFAYVHDRAITFPDRTSACALRWDLYVLE
jgi:hypothetical protein